MPVVVSDEEKALFRRQVGIRKASASESLLTCRKFIVDIKTGAFKASREHSGGCPLIGRGVSGMETMRA